MATRDEMLADLSSVADDIFERWTGRREALANAIYEELFRPVPGAETDWERACRYADALETLSRGDAEKDRRIEELEAALRPLDELASDMIEGTDDYGPYQAVTIICGRATHHLPVTLGDLRRASALLGEDRHG